tara:strand:- start:23314 stop:24723 length:1410 start_codon:yes stop_codon:yes gene_type:complete
MTKKRKLRRYFHGGPHDANNISPTTGAYYREDATQAPIFGGTQYYQNSGPYTGPGATNEMQVIPNHDGSSFPSNITPVQTASDDTPWNRPMRANPNGNTNTTNTTNTTTNTTSSSSYWKSGKDVETLQNDLISQGYKLPVYGVDSKYGNETDAAFKQREADIAAAADAAGVDPSEIEYRDGKWQPKIVEAATDETVVTEEDDAYAYDSEGNAVIKEDVDVDEEDVNNADEETKKKWYQKLGVGNNDILNVIEGLTIMKANRNAINANKKIGSLKVKSDRLRPNTYNPELVDLSEAKKNAKELATAAVQKNIQEGKSTAETRALLTGGAEAQEKIAKTESELQKQESNIAKKMNIEERSRVEMFNISNDRKDQIANNDTMASMYKNSIAISNNMRDAVLTKIKDYKLLSSAENQMQMIGDAIAGNTGLDNRKFNGYIDNMVNYGAMTAEEGSTMKKNYKTFNAKKEESNG